MAQKIRYWLWPDHVIAKRECRTLREEHNKTVKLNADLVATLDGLCDLPADDAGDRIIPAGFLDAARTVTARARR